MYVTTSVDGYLVQAQDMAYSGRPDNIARTLIQAYGEAHKRTPRTPETDKLWSDLMQSTLAIGYWQRRKIVDSKIVHAWGTGRIEDAKRLRRERNDIDETLSILGLDYVIEAFENDCHRVDPLNYKPRAAERPVRNL